MPALWRHRHVCFNTAKNKWNCRAGGIGGNDGIGMAAHCEGLDMHQREGLLDACSIVLDRPVPGVGKREPRRGTYSWRVKVRVIGAFISIACSRSRRISSRVILIPGNHEPLQYLSIDAGMMAASCQMRYFPRSE